ncbi:uncharacterized protein LOC131146340 isoform X2 [Malania oleifera]|uniref:uncharacterized protein LOC131146340 isoform X2 n=1 Tax=Malania oleifera TaxID=397392 RepID=UPI0025AE4699|nr:uncharacterized protein LOC131146340 isoform X2 [Malania oleifera]
MITRLRLDIVLRLMSYRCTAHSHLQEYHMISSCFCSCTHALSHPNQFTKNHHPARCCHGKHFVFWRSLHSSSCPKVKLADKKLENWKRQGVCFGPDLVLLAPFQLLMLPCHPQISRKLMAA